MRKLMELKFAAEMLLKYNGQYHADEGILSRRGGLAVHLNSLRRGRDLLHADRPA